MKRGNILEQLWYAHESLRVTEWTEEAEKLMDELEACEKDLFANLTQAQQDALESYKTHIDDLRVLFEKEAFMKGVRFATAYLIEAMGPSDEV